MQFTLNAQQNYYAKNFTVENGLPNNSVRYITQDKTGFLWICTWDGLSRYDGYEFKNYFHIPDDSSTIPYFSPRTLCVDFQNNVWVLTDLFKVSKYNRASDNFTRVFSAMNTESENSPIFSITTDKHGKFWMLDNTNLYRYDYIKSKFERYDIENSVLLTTSNIASTSLLFDNLILDLSVSP